MGAGLIAIDASATRQPQPLPASQWTFPDPRSANAFGLVARGGDFEPATLLDAYRNGMFPWPHGEEDHLWFSPELRAVIPAGGLHISRRLRRTLLQGRFTASIDREFEVVMSGCANREEGTWITPAYQDGFRRLHELGWAHSIEVWTRDGVLAGGLYGLAIGGVFFAESMFHHVTDASKAAMVALLQRVESRGLLLVDVQMPTPHLERMGALSIPRDHYLASLPRALNLNVLF